MENKTFDYRTIALNAIAHSNKGLHDEATVLFENAWKEAPDEFTHKKNVFDWAEMSLDINRREQFLKQIVEHDEMHMASFQLATIDLQRNNHQAAIMRLNNLLPVVDENDALYGQILLHLGNAYTLARQPEKAQEFLAKASQIIPDNPVLLNNLAFQMTLAGKEPFRAIEVAERALELIDRDAHDMRAHILDTLGFAQYRANLLSHAESTLQRSIRNKAMPENYMHLGKVYLAQNNPSQARQMLELAKAAVQDESVTDEHIIREIDDYLKTAREEEAELEKQRASAE